MPPASSQTFQARNGTLQACEQLPLAHPRRWAAFIEDVADRSGCTADELAQAIRTLTEAIEVLLRPKPRPPRDGSAPTSERPHIQVNGRFDREIIADAMHVLIAANDEPTLLMRGDALVHVRPDSVVAHMVDTPRPARTCRRVCRLHHGHVHRGGRVRRPSRLPFTVCQDFLVKPLAQAFPSLSGIRTAPIFLPDGRLLATEGYDPMSGYLLRLGELQGIRTDMSVTEAWAWLQDELLVDFPFSGAYSRAHTLALLLEPFVKPLIEGEDPGVPHRCLDARLGEGATGGCRLYDRHRSDGTHHGADRG